MAKRLTDTAKWKNPWFRTLPTKFKMLFLYMLDECDNAGVMHLDFELIGFLLKEEYSKTEFEFYFKEKICFLADDKIIIKSFVNYQQGSLGNSSTMHRHITKVLETHGIREKYENGDFK